MFLLNLFKRTFNSNLKTVSASGAERIALASAGVTQPTIQNYLAWRRGLLAFVVIATTAGVGLSLYREWTEEDAGVDIFEKLKEHFSEHLPVGIDLEKAKEQAQEKVDEIKENHPDAAEMESKVREVIEENAPGGKKSNEQDPDEQQDSTGPDLGEQETPTEAEETPISAKTQASPTATTDTEPHDAEPQSFLAKYEDLIHEVAYYLLPVAALAAMFLWTRYNLSSYILIIAFAFSFLFPIFFAFAPWSWWDGAEANLPANASPAQKLEHAVDGLVEGAKYLAALLPTLISLIPGIQKASLRVKTLLPQSILPGWFLVSLSPFYALFLLIIFVAINQVLSTPLFFAGMILFISAPLIYVLRARVFTAPLATPEDYRRMLLTQKMVGGLTALAGVLLLVFLVSKTGGDVMGIRLYGIDSTTALLTPLDLVEFVIQTLSRGMFMTVLGADVFMRMNISAWKNTRAFEGTKEAAEYNEIIGSMESTASAA